MDLNQTYAQDLCQYSNLTQQLILECLSQRYRTDKIFTFIGPILLVINPYKYIKQLFSPEVLQKVVKDTLKGTLINTPHIYVIAAKAFLAMDHQNTNQSIVISGESGAGKTQSAKYCMIVIAHLGNSRSHSLSEKILACNPLLEAFGNSKTIKNENSSRFGKFTQIFFDKSKKILGAKIQTYLLEKSRVSMVELGERNFHIFYALTASGFLGAKSAKEYAYLRRSECYVAQGIDDMRLFTQVNHSLGLIGYDEAERQNIWRILLAVLELGNLQFDDKKFKENQNKNSCEIIDRSSSYGFIISALKTTNADFQSLILKNSRGKFKNNARKIDCIKNRDALAKAVYSFCFKKIIDKIQVVLSPHKPNNYEPIAFSFSLLDIFGYQNLKNNSLQQICINFTNQRLLAQYNQKIFENQISILREDGLSESIGNIVMPTNKIVVGLVRQIFNIVNQCTTNDFYNEQHMIQRISSIKNQMNIPYKRLTSFFKISHSPCQVEYSIVGFKVKNQDKITPQINQVCIKLFGQSSILIKSQAKTILSGFNQHLDELVNKLKESSNHFVRCIKTNQQKKPQTMIREYLQTQIKYLGVFQTVKIRQAIFPCRKTYEYFAAKYRQMFCETKNKTDKEATMIIIEKMNAPNETYLYGNVRVYMKSELEEQIEQCFRTYMKKKLKIIIFIQRRYRLTRTIRQLKEKVLAQVRIIRKEKILKNLQQFIEKCFNCTQKSRLAYQFAAFEQIKNQAKRAIVEKQASQMRYEQEEPPLYQFKSEEKETQTEQQQYNNLKEEYDRLKESHERLEGIHNKLKQDNDAIKHQLTEQYQKLQYQSKSHLNQINKRDQAETTFRLIIDEQTRKIKEMQKQIEYEQYKSYRLSTQIEEIKQNEFKTKEQLEEKEMQSKFKSQIAKEKYEQSIIAKQKQLDYMIKRNQAQVQTNGQHKKRIQQMEEKYKNKQQIIAKHKNNNQYFFQEQRQIFQRIKLQIKKVRDLSANKLALQAIKGLKIFIEQLQKSFERKSLDGHQEPFQILTFNTKMKNLIDCQKDDKMKILQLTQKIQEMSLNKKMLMQKQEEINKNQNETRLYKVKYNQLKDRCDKMKFQVDHYYKKAETLKSEVKSLKDENRKLLEKKGAE